MHKHEIHSIKHRLEELYPSKRIPLDIPSFDHCIGTDKLLGEYYGQALTESLLLLDDDNCHILNKLCLFLRAYVVIDDCLKDKPVRKNLLPLISHWLKNVEDEIIHLITKLGGKAELWEDYYKIYQRAYYSYDFSDPFQSTMNKCSFIFLPFDLPIFKKDGANPSLIKNFFECFLFSLQLLDDFKDMHEDRFSPRNHNLYIAKLTDKFTNLIVNHKVHLLPSILNLIKINLMKLNRIAVSNIMSIFCKKSLMWIKTYSLQLQSERKIDSYFSSFENWKILDDSNIDEIKSILFRSKEISFNMDQISAESMHTLTT